MSLKDPKTYLIGIGCTLLALFAGWLNGLVTPFSFAWVVTALVILASCGPALYFWYLLARVNLAVIAVLMVLGWIITKPW